MNKQLNLVEKLNNCLNFHGVSVFMENETVVFESILGRVFRNQKRGFNDEVIAEVISELGWR